MKVGTDGVLLGAWAPCEGARRIVDAGAGSGLIALMVAQREPSAYIAAIEIDAEAATCCSENVMRSPWAERVAVHHADVMLWETDSEVDLIVSNPPFFSEALQSPEAARARARHSGEFGPASLVDIALRLLADSGKLAMIVPEGEVADVIWQAEIRRLKVRRECLVYAKPGDECIRRMLVFARHDGPIEHSTLTIRKSDGTYTDQFIDLTRDYYIRFSKSKP